MNCYHVIFDSSWMPYYESTSRMGAFDLVGSVLRVYVFLHVAFGQLFCTVWANRLLLSFIPIILVSFTHLLVFFFTDLMMLLPVICVGKVSWTKSTFVLHLTMVVRIEMLEIFFPGFGLKIRTDSTLCVMKNPGFLLMFLHCLS